MIRYPLTIVEFTDVNSTGYELQLCRPEQIYRIEAGWHWVTALILTNLADETAASIYLPGNCSFQSLQIAVLWIPHWLSRRQIEVNAHFWADSNPVVQAIDLSEGAEVIAGARFQSRDRREGPYQIVLFEPLTSDETLSVCLYMGNFETEKPLVMQVSAKNGIASTMEAIRVAYTNFTAEFNDESEEFFVEGFQKRDHAISHKHLLRMLFSSTYSDIFVAKHDSINWNEPFEKHKL